MMADRARGDICYGPSVPADLRVGLSFGSAIDRRYQRNQVRSRTFTDSSQSAGAMLVRRRFGVVFRI